MLYPPELRARTPLSIPDRSPTAFPRYNKEMSPEQVVAQFQQILATLQRIVNASSDLNDRVDALEASSGETLGRLTELQGNLQILLDTYQSHAKAQSELNEHLAQSLAALDARVELLENH